MSRIQLYLFGPPRLESDGVEIEVRPRKALALMIYLTVTNRPHSRDALATLLWPESDQVAARASLRRTLYLLQQALPIDLVVTAGDTIQVATSFATQGELWIDTRSYETLLADHLAKTPASAWSDETRLALEKAVTHYKDDFLAGFTLEDAPAFDEWQFFQQESLRQSFAQLLLQLKQSHTAKADYGQAIEVGRRLLALDPLHEPSHRELMLLYAWAGQQAAALRQYQECQRILHDELGVEPEEETIKLFQAIRTKQIPPPVIATQAAPSNTPNLELATSAQPVATQPLPLYSTEFVGRVRELEYIDRLLTQEANCRLLTLVGPSGIGKTRLALEVARGIQAKGIQAATPAPKVESFADGVVFVPLAAVSEPHGIFTAVAAAAGLQFGSATSSQQPLLNTLRDKKMLLVLDHFEHLLTGAPLLSEIMRAAPMTKILVTSRESIHLQGAWVLPVGTLSFPTKHGGNETDLRDYEAIRLFERRARHVRISFDLAEETAHVVRICQLVEGMPLAIELAATWLKVLNTERIADEIERSIDILTTAHEDVPSRHRSLRAVLEQSWKLLLPQERVVFMRLSIFRGGFTDEAARVVVGAELMMLATLVDKSLLQLHNDGRYQCHELLRQFAAEQLLLWTEEFNEVSHRHCAYFMDFLKRHGQGIKGRGQKQALAEISADIGNVMLAWRTAVERRALPELIAAAQCVWLFSHYRGMLDEGEAAFAHALTELTHDSTPRDSTPTEVDAQSALFTELIAFLYAGQGWIQGRRGDLENGRALQEKGIARLREAPRPNPELEAFAVSYLALTVQYQERQLEAREIVKVSLALYTAIGDLWGMAMGFEIAGTAALGYGQLEEAKQLLTSCLTIAQAAGEPRSRLLAMTYLGLIAVTTGEYSEAKALLDEALSMSTELGDRIATSVILTKLGKYALAQGEYASALQYFERTLAIQRTAGIAYAGEVLDCLCDTHRARGDFAAAEQIGRQALQMAQERAIQRRISGALSMLGCIALARLDYTQAVELQTQAMSLCRELSHEPDLASILRFLGHSALSRGEPYTIEARLHYQKALQLALKHRLAPIALDCFVGVAELLRHIHDNETAGELWQLVATHAAATAESRQRARHLLEAHRAVNHLPGEPVPSWQAMAEALHGRLAQPDWGQKRSLIRNMPAYPTAFVGRQQEIADISQTLENPSCRVLTLVGLGGIGKSRLSIQVAHHLATSEQGQRLFAHGILYVPLALVTDEDGLTAAIAEAMGLASYAALPLRQQLLQTLARQAWLLILDNFEQMAAQTALLSEILSEAPGVKLLITSRMAVDLAEAWFYPVGGMSFPADKSTQPLESFEAVQLFVQCAQRVRANFSVANSSQSIVRICQLVEGLPLAIELAASWLKVLTVENVAEEISRGMDILASHTTAQQNTVPARHQSMRVIMEQTWMLLSEDEKHAFMSLALFCSGFRRDAAGKVAGATLSLLAQFVEKSLLRVTEKGRYSIHELLRQFALEKLQQFPSVEEQVQTLYSDYYLDFLAQRWQSHLGWRRQSIAEEVEEEIDNITNAWQCKLQVHDLDAIERSMTSYPQLLWKHGYGQMGKDVFAQALDELDHSPTARRHPRYAVVYQLILYQLGMCYTFLGEFATSARFIEMALAARRRMRDKTAIGEALTTLGTVMSWQGQHKIAYHHLNEARALFEEMDDKNGLGDVLHELARMALYEGEYAKSKQLASQSLGYSQELQRLDSIAYALMERSVGAFFLGQYDECRRDLEETLALFQEIEHPVGTAFALGELAWLTWATGGMQSAEAEGRARQSLEIARKIGHRLQIAYRLAQLAQFANDRRAYDEAVSFAQEGLTLARSLGNPHFASQNLCMLAEAAYHQRDYGMARRYLGEACHMAEKAGLRSRVLMSLYHAALALVREADARGQEDQKAQAIGWLELYLRHPASSYVGRERGARHLAYVRAQAPAAAQLAVRLAGEEEAIETSLKNAVDVIIAWATVGSV